MGITIKEITCHPAPDRESEYDVRSRNKVDKLVFKQSASQSRYVAIAHQLSINNWLTNLYTKINLTEQNNKRKTFYIINSSIPTIISQKFLTTLKRSINDCTQNFISDEQILNVLAYKETTFNTESQLIKKQLNEKFARSALFDKLGNYILMTSTKQHDKLIGQGGVKKAKFAINLDKVKKHVVVTCKRKSCINTSWKETLENVKYEIALMERFKGKNCIIQIDTSFIKPDATKVYIIMEYCDRGDLFDYLYHSSSPNNSISDQLQIALDCATGLKNMHNEGIAHRDIKAGNIFLYTQNGNIRAKIADLGYGGQVGDIDKPCGTWDTMAPERLTQQSKVSSNSDVWSLGTVYYNLFHPQHHSLKFQQGDDAREGVKKIIATKQEELDQEVASSGIDSRLIPLIQKMLSVNPNERPSMEIVRETVLTLLLKMNIHTNSTCL